MKDIHEEREKISRRAAKKTLEAIAAVAFIVIAALLTAFFVLNLIPGGL
jgi:hypothetical protein